MTSVIAGAVIGFLAYENGAPLWKNIVRVVAGCAALIITYYVGRGEL